MSLDMSGGELGNNKSDLHAGGRQSQQKLMPPGLLDMYLCILYTCLENF